MEMEVKFLAVVRKEWIDVELRKQSSKNQAV